MEAILVFKFILYLAQIERLTTLSYSQWPDPSTLAWVSHRNQGPGAQEPKPQMSLPTHPNSKPSAVLL